jgi:hypothetical protein
MDIFEIALGILAIIWFIMIFGIIVVICIGMSE